MTKIRLVQSNIVELKLDAIVNAANTSLLGGGGVDGAIHRAGGPTILEECKKIRNRQGGCKVGQAVITTGGNLPARFVIHTVGPTWNGGNNKEEEMLKNAYQNSLLLATENNIQSIAFPNISTGIYRFPKEKAARIAIDTIQEFVNESNMPSEILFCCFDSENFKMYKQLLG